MRREELLVSRLETLFDGEAVEEIDRPVHTTNSSQNTICQKSRPAKSPLFQKLISIYRNQPVRGGECVDICTRILVNCRQTLFKQVQALVK